MSRGGWPETQQRENQSPEATPDPPTGCLPAGPGGARSAGRAAGTFEKPVAFAAACAAAAAAASAARRLRAACAAAAAEPG